MTHLSRLSEELILWMSPRFGFIDLADRFCTGSCIMPQKKNPDVPELVRGKTGRVNGHLVALLTLMKGQPLAYNKDNQEDKEPLFDTVDTLTDTLAIYADMLRGVTVKPEAMRAAVMQGFATATDLADYLVKKGVPFRDAHEVVARAVRAADTSGRDLADLALAELQAFSPMIADDVYDVLTLEGSLAARDHLGGTAPAQVRAAIARARQRHLRLRNQGLGCHGRSVLAANPPHLRAAELFLHQPAKIAARPEPLVVTTGRAHAEAALPALRLHLSQHLPQHHHRRRHPRRAGGLHDVAPGAAGAQRLQQVGTAFGQNQPHHPAIAGVGVARHQPAARQHQHRLRHRALGQPEIFGQRLRGVAEAVGLIQVKQHLQMHRLQALCRARLPQVGPGQQRQPLDQIKQGERLAFQRLD